MEGLVSPKFSKHSNVLAKGREGDAILQVHHADLRKKLDKWEGGLCKFILLAKIAS